MYERNNDNLIFYGYHLCGINTIDKVFCKIIVTNDLVSIYTGNKLIKEITTSCVKQIGVDQEYTDKKSTLGRTFLGGFIGGLWGAAIGALSAELSSIDTVVSFIETNSEVIFFESV